MDDVDITNQREEMLLEARLKNRKPSGPASNGACLWCEEPFEDATQRWCDKHCRNDFDRAVQNAPHLIP